MLKKSILSILAVILISGCTSTTTSSTVPKIQKNLSTSKDVYKPRKHFIPDDIKSTTLYL